MSPARMAFLIASAGCAAGCGQTIEPPVTIATAKKDEPMAVPNRANADPNLKPGFGPFDVQTVFYVEKSKGKDRVDYAIRLDQACAPVSDEAMFPYWRDLEKAPPVKSHPLRFFQYVAYGISEQQMLEKTKTGGRYRVLLKQVDRPIVVVTGRDAQGHCAATPYTVIGTNKGARLDHIFAQLSGAISVEYVEVHGTDPGTGEVLTERMKP